MLKIPEEKQLKIYADGASRGNPGPSAIAFIFVMDEKSVFQKNEFIGKQTNNQAEYQAIIKALLEAKKNTQGAVEVLSDSELVIKQINGDYQVKNIQLLEFFQEVTQRKRAFQKISFTHVPRDNQWITMADKLCNKCLNDYFKKK